jgi:hypothetical protein
MAYSLQIDETTTLTLPGSLHWDGEFGWVAMGQSVGTAVTGALVIQESARLAGRPIDLLANDGSPWIRREDLIALHASVTPGREMVLTVHDGRAFTVRWRLEGGSPIEAETVLPGLADPIDEDWYHLYALRFIEV